MPNDLYAPRPHPLRPSARAVRDLRGGVRLVLDGVRAGIDRVERAHRRLAQVDPPVRGLRLARPDSTLGSLLYRGLRGSADLLGGGLDLALASAQAALADTRPTPLVPAASAPSAPAADSATRDAIVAALNALAGDHLHRTGNPLAIPTELHVRGPVRPRVLVLVHDFGLGGQHWLHDGRDLGKALADAVGCTPVHAQYNSGRHVPAVGRELASELEALLGHWRVPLEGVALVGHGLGGLVIRSALLQASRAGLGWPAHVRHIVFLGTPHHGAQLRGATMPLRAWRVPQAALPPLARLARRRSDGLSDLLEGRILERDARTGDAPLHATVGLPPTARCHAIAGRIGDGRGDGLVPVDSALGRHPVATRDLQLPESHRWTVDGVDHFGLLGSEAAFQKMRQWLSA